MRTGEPVDAEAKRVLCHTVGVSMHFRPPRSGGALERAFFAYRTFEGAANLVGWGFSLYVLADLVCVTCHPDWTVFCLPTPFRMSLIWSPSCCCLWRQAVPLLESHGKGLDWIETLLVPVDGTAGGAVVLSAMVGLLAPRTPSWCCSTLCHPRLRQGEKALRSAGASVEGSSGCCGRQDFRSRLKRLKREAAPTIDFVVEETGADMVEVSRHTLTRSGPSDAGQRRRCRRASPAVLLA
jgi:hypothetical protein